MPSAARTIARKSGPALSIAIRLAVPAGGFGRQLAVMHAWLDAHCGPGGWASAPAGLAGIRNDALALYFADASQARAFVARFCCGYRWLPPEASGPCGS